MYPRKPLPHAEQLARLKRYLRRSRTELRHRYEESFEATKGRRECPLEVSIRRGMTEHYRNAVSLLEACVEELQRQQAMFLAPFKPGDCIEVERTVDGTPKMWGIYMVVDVLPDKRTKYCYDCVALTKSGSLYKRRGSARICPDTWTTIAASDVSLNEVGRWEAEYFRRCAQTSHQLAFSTGDITLFESRKDLLDRTYYRRKDRLDP